MVYFFPFFLFPFLDFNFRAEAFSYSHERSLKIHMNAKLVFKHYCPIGKAFELLSFENSPQICGPGQWLVSGPVAIRVVGTIRKTRHT